MVMWIPRNSKKSQLYTDVNNECHTLGREARRRVWPQVWIASLLCADRIFFFLGGLHYIQCDDYLNIFFLNRKPGKNILAPTGLCTLCGASELGDGFSCAGEAGACRPKPLHSVHRERLCLLNDAGITGFLFNLKSAGFKALCWQ